MAKRLGCDASPWSRGAPRSGIKTLIITGLAVVALQGCDKYGPDPVGPPRRPAMPRRTGFSVALEGRAAGEIAAAVGGRTERSVEDDILRLESRVPSLGGIYLDSAEQVLVAFVRDSSMDSTARRELSAFVQARGNGLMRSLESVKRVQLRRGQYAFSALVAGQKALAVEPNPSLVTLDADEAQNRISVGVMDSAGLYRVREAAAKAGIPDAALSVTIVPGAPALRSDLIDRARPTAGGIIFGPAGGTANGCSIGWNVTRVDSSGVNYFISAAHCLKEWAGSDLGPRAAGSYDPYATNAATGAAQDELGTLSYVAYWFDAGCDGAHGPLCTNGDVMQFRYYNSVTSVKNVVKTDHPGLNSSVGSTTKVGVFTINGLTTAPVGTSVDKVGWHTGWTRGSVVNTCETVYFYGPSRPIDGNSWIGETCLTRTTGMNVLGGDSGAPVFNSPGAGQTIVGAIGIAEGAFVNFYGTCSDSGGYSTGPCTAWFLPWDKIEARLDMVTGGGLVPY